ncbi:ANGE1 protein, partial [Aphelocoma coerulescens]|nr:ANGE1 protein [Aphelocoma coerulescens]
MIGTVLCYVLLPAARLLQALRDAFFTCRKNVLLAKSPSTQIEGVFAATRGTSVSEEQEALLQQWLEEGVENLPASESVPAVRKVPVTLTSDWFEGSELLMTSLSDLNTSPEVTRCADQQLSELNALASSELQDHAVAELARLPAEETLTVGGSAPWAAVVPQTDHQTAGCAGINVEVLNDDPAVLAWSLACDAETVPPVLPARPIQDAVPFYPVPTEVPYHEILWRDWEDLSVQPCVLEQVSKTTPLFEFRVMSYNILAQDLVEQGLDLYVHCHPDILNWNYRLPNLLQEIQHWDPDVLCLQEVQENHYWEQLEPTFKEMGFACFYKRRTGTKTDGCAVCYKHSRFQLISLSPIEYFRPGLDILNRDNVGLVLLLQPVLPEGLGLKAVSPLCVANTHVLFNPRRGDIKLAQVALLLAEIDKIARTTEGSYYPVILCGDLNSVPDSPLYKFIRNGELSYHGMPAWKVVSGQEDFSQHSYSRKLLAPLWPSSLGVTDKCQYVTLCQPKKLGRREYSRDFLLQFRFCHVACERPPQLVLLEGVTDAKPVASARDYSAVSAILKRHNSLSLLGKQCSGVIQHGLNLTSVYSHFLPQRGRPEVTTMPMGLGATVDYIFYSAEPVENKAGECRRLYKDGALKLLGRLSLLSEDVLLMANGLPNRFCSSDHLCLLASFGLEISSL